MTKEKETAQEQMQNVCDALISLWQAIVIETRLDKFCKWLNDKLTNFYNQHT